MYYLGIDGGGTKTQFTIINENVEVIQSIKKGTSHFKQIGLTGVEGVLREGLNEVLNKSNLTKDKIDGVCIGLAGYGNIREDREKLQNIIEKVFKDFNYIIRNDVEIAISGALNGDDGIVIVSGTGSIALSK